LTDDEAQALNGEIYMLKQAKSQKLYGNRVMGFNVIFKTPYLLPANAALGRGVSLGAGTFQKLKVNPESSVSAFRLRSRRTSNVKVDNIPEIQRQRKVHQSKTVENY